jgi:hypothetical protein
MLVIGAPERIKQVAKMSKHSRQLRKYYILFFHLRAVYVCSLHATRSERVPFQ